MKQIRAEHLRAGMAFRRIGQRKWRIAINVWTFTEAEIAKGCPRGFLASLRDCTQLVLCENEWVEVPETPDAMDRDGFIKLGPRRKGSREWK